MNAAPIKTTTKKKENKKEKNESVASEINLLITNILH